MTWSPDLVTWPDHLTWHTTSSEQFHEVMISAHPNRHHPQTYNLHSISDPQPMLVIKTYTRCHLINTLYTVRSPTSSGAKWLRLPTFIFYSLVIVLKRINLVLLGSAGACQPRTTNESHRTGGDNGGAWITSHCSAPWSHLETWWGDRLVEAWLSM